MVTVVSGSVHGTLVSDTRIGRLFLGFIWLIPIHLYPVVAVGVSSSPNGNKSIAPSDYDFYYLNVHYKSI